ncbi:MAG: ATP-binding protein [Leeuwenhoekiella sp.]
MNTKRVVLIGGPATGKSTLLKAIEAKGYPCLEEVSRQVTKAAQEEGISQLFLTKPLLFSEKLLDQRIIQFEQAATFKAPFVFIDRGIPDVVAYLDYVGEPYPQSFLEDCTKYMYDVIFVLPPWEEIHETDGERYENFEQAQAIQEALLNSYRKLGYTPVEVPKMSVKKRVDFVLNYLKK